ncbi:MAG: hypothetical protein HYX90_00790 [Chloroflexi bacterium]|nr:hypothetical protein [Chloroflexota bacterium]
MEQSCEERLMKAAKSRLRMELLGLAFAISRKATPEEYARFVWSTGAVTWMGSAHPGAGEYLDREREAAQSIFPWLKFEEVFHSSVESESLITGGCLEGWGENRFTLARSLGLNRAAVCRYCVEACRVWGEQLGLRVEPRPGPGCRGGCRIRAERTVSSA